MKNFHIIRLGCPKNDADMDILRGIMENWNYVFEENIEKSELIIIDTCGFIESAKQESIDIIFETLETKKNNKNIKKVVAIGCLVQRYFDELKNEIPEIDGLFGVIPPQEIIDNIEKNNYFYKRDIPYDVYECKFRYVPETSYAYVKIADGCNRNCAFCAIPGFKGEPTSRKIEDIRNEVENLVNNGIKEIILVSQDNTLYGLDLYKKQSLPNLLTELNKINGDFWIRVMYLHPDFLTDEIIESIHSNEKVLNYFDVPMQHGSDNILKKMKRVKNVKQLKKMIEKIREADSILRSTFIVGFPGETEEDFEQLINFIDEIEFDRMGAFEYSAEEGTEAFDYKDDVEEDEKKRRMENLMELQKEISESVMEEKIGKTFEVLVEEYEDGVYIGRSFMDAPEIDGNILIKTEKKIEIKKFYNVKITESYEYDLGGKLC